MPIKSVSVDASASANTTVTVISTRIFEPVRPVAVTLDIDVKHVNSSVRVFLTAQQVAQVEPAPGDPPWLDYRVTRFAAVGRTVLVVPLTTIRTIEPPIALNIVHTNASATETEPLIATMIYDTEAFIAPR